MDILERGIQLCCHVHVQLQYNNMEEKKDLINRSIIMPVSRRSYQTTIAYGRPFVGLVDAPAIAVITQASVPGADLLMAILDSWPILIFIITTISLSGLMIWLLVSCQKYHIS